MSPTARPSGLFITGTDTNVGKTQIATRIVGELRAKSHRVGVYKPVCSGASGESPPQWDDIERLRAALGLDLPDEIICPQRFLAPLAPHLAARAEARFVDFERLVSGMDWWRGRADLMIVEGAGGLLAPVTDTKTVADLARAVHYPLVIVARCGLGTINHTLLTIEAARNRQLAIAGVVLNQSHPEDNWSLAESNAVEIETRSGVSVFGFMKYGSDDGLQRHESPVTIRWSDLADG